MNLMKKNSRRVVLLLAIFAFLFNINLTFSSPNQDCLYKGGQPRELIVTYGGCEGKLTLCCFELIGETNSTGGKIIYVDYQTFECFTYPECNILIESNLTDANFWYSIDNQVLNFLNTISGYGAGPCNGANVNFYKFTRNLCNQLENIPNPGILILQPCLGSEVKCKKTYRMCWTYVNGTSGATVQEIQLISSSVEGLSNCSGIYPDLDYSPSHHPERAPWLSWITECFSSTCN